MIIDEPQDDAKGGLIRKKSTLVVQPINDDNPPANVGVPGVAGSDELKALSERVNQLASSAAEHSQVQALSATNYQPEVIYQQQAVASAAPQHDNAVVNLIRGKLSRIYSNEPDAAEEAVEAYQLGAARSKHQQYMFDLTNSGRGLAEIQVQWHNYYASLSDLEKHEVWQEFYSAHASAQHAPKTEPLPALPHKPTSHAHKTQFKKNKVDTRTIAEIKQQVLKHVSGSGMLKAKHHFQSLLFGVGLATLFVVLLLFSFFNERFIAPFVSPSRQVSATPIVGAGIHVSADSKVIIPKINVEVPVIYGIDTNSEKDVQDALEGGVVHYSTSPSPGETGNVVIVGHSSNNILNKGKYKFAFVLLKRLEIGDTFSLNKNGTRYTYQIYEKKVVKPTDISVLGPSTKPNTATLITCDPPGTSINRLVVIGDQISPNPTSNTKVTETIQKLNNKGVIPSNSPSLWQRFKDFL